MRSAAARTAATLALCVVVGATCPGDNPCACPPARTRASITVRVNTPSGPVVAAAILLRSSMKASCTDTTATEALDYESVVTDANGRAHIVPYSLSGNSTQCVYATARRTVGTVTDSASAAPTLVPFLWEGAALPDSVLLQINFP